MPWHRHIEVQAQSGECSACYSCIVPSLCTCCASINFAHVELRQREWAAARTGEIEKSSRKQRGLVRQARCMRAPTSSNSLFYCFLGREICSKISGLSARPAIKKVICMNLQRWCLTLPMQRAGTGWYASRPNSTLGQFIRHSKASSMARHTLHVLGSNQHKKALRIVLSTRRPNSPNHKIPLIFR